MLIDPPISAWCATLAVNPINLLSLKIGVIILTSGLCPAFSQGLLEINISPS